MKDKPADDTYLEYNETLEKRFFDYHQGMDTDTSKSVAQYLRRVVRIKHVPPVVVIDYMRSFARRTGFNVFLSLHWIQYLKSVNEYPRPAMPPKQNEDVPMDEPILQLISTGSRRQKQTSFIRLGETTC